MTTPIFTVQRKKGLFETTLVLNTTDINELRKVMEGQKVVSIKADFNNPTPLNISDLNTEEVINSASRVIITIKQP